MIFLTPWQYQVFCGLRDDLDFVRDWLYLPVEPFNLQFTIRLSSCVKHLNFAAIGADSVLVFHAAFALFAVLGALLVVQTPWLALIHIPVVAWSSLVNLAHWTCPLTPLEKLLRRHAGQGGFEGGWIQHYLDPLVRPLGMPRRMEIIAGVSVIVGNLLLYIVLFV